MQLLSALVTLSHGQKASLKKANILSVDDLILISPADLARKCKIIPSEAQNIVNLVCKEIAPRIHSLNDSSVERDQVFTTGDNTLDQALLGGIRTRKLWEITGESAAGKTQLALQLALCVQLPSDFGGISGSTCFLSTSWTLPTQRLLEIIENHPQLSFSMCSLSDIHTLKIPTIPILLHVLSTILPKLLDELIVRSDAKPVKLLIIDALTELFHSTSRVSSLSLKERSRHIAEISTLIHSLARQRNIAVVVMNEVVDVFDRDVPQGAMDNEVLYQDQVRLFSRADSIPSENRKEAALGLVWANQVNVRIMLTRTSRMHQLDILEVRSAKRRRVDTHDDAPQDATNEATRLRRLTVIFSSVSSCFSLDYIITQAGLTFIADQTTPLTYVESVPSPNPINNAPTPSFTIIPSTEPTEIELPDLLETLQAVEPEFNSDDFPQLPSEDVAEAEDVEGPGQKTDDEWDAYWTNAEIGSDAYTQVDLEALTSSSP